MRKIVLFLLFSLGFLYVKAQKLEVGFSLGTGSVYIIENADSAVNSSFGAPSLFSGYINYTPENSYFGLKLKYLNLNASLKGEDWQNLNQSLFPSSINGFIENRTLLFQLERLKLQQQKLNFGYNLGMGISKEVLSFDKQGQNSFVSSFSVVSFGGIIAYSLNHKLSLRIEPTLLWNDPLRSFNSSNYRMGGEDINFLVEFGISYRLN